MDSVAARAVEILTTADPWTKAALTAKAVAAASQLPTGDCEPPARPGRPARPELRRPGDMPKRSTGPKGKIALVHALAHVELNAVDLAWDIIARFATPDLPRAFVDDWLSVAAEEADHFLALDRRLNELGAAYGDLPAHDGLWLAAIATSGDLLARLAVVPLTLEARGLDVTPMTTERLRKAGDEETAKILDVIYADEIKHLAVGMRWFTRLCSERNEAPVASYRSLLARHHKGGLKPPFNLEARAHAGMSKDYLTDAA